MKNVQYLLALHSIDGLGPIRLKALLDFYQDPKIAWEANSGELVKMGIPQNVVEKLKEARKKLDPGKYLDDIQKSAIKYSTIFDETYPSLLKQIYDPPILFYYKGEILPRDEKAIAVVGTRKITGYGKLVTEQFVTKLAGVGLTIVSGLARGVDSQAHQTALEAGGRTLAILGGGLNKIFPPENTQLAEKIADGRGAVISEFPPDHPSLSGNFPARNRIISGLSLATLVTEAAVDSGSLITARLALEQNRDVFAVPGPVTSQLSKGPADLIKEGARLVFEPEDVLEELGLERVQSAEFRVNNDMELDRDEKKLLDYLKNEGKHIDEICRNLSLPVAEVSGKLLKMEISGLVRNLGGGVYVRVLV